MNTSTPLVKNLLGYVNSIREHIGDTGKRLQKAPAGTLRISKSHNKFQYYHRKETDESCGTYLPRKEQAIAQKLAQKDYDERLLKVLEEQLKSIEQFLKTFDPKAPQKVYENLSNPRKALVKPEFITDEEYVKQWLSQPYKKMGFKADDPEFYTTGGVRVRSKSEVIIAEALERHNIPYRYEYPVYQDGVLMAAPDFNCLNVRLRKEYYWEHLGMLDDEAYADNNVRKLNKYTLNPDFDESRLILTTETKKHPLNTKVIEEKIRRYLL